ncbi:MAG: DMT family transporter [Hyphomicrobiaceae bacterium]
MPPTSRGITMMVISTVFFASMHAAIRYIAFELHPFQIAFFRNFFGLLIFLPIALRMGFGVFHTTRLGLHVVRSILNIGAMLAFFTALSITPIAKVTALSFTSPIFMAVLSVLILGERMRVRRWVATICGFIGTLIILRPGVEALDFGSILVVGSASVWAFTMIVIKFLARTESSVTITAYMNVFLSLLSLVPAIFTWQQPSLEAWLWLAFIGIAGTLGQLTLAESLKQTEATAVMPFDFLKLVWAAFLGYLLFAEIPTLYTWTGAAIIFASGLYIAYRESVLARKVVKSATQ